MISLKRVDYTSRVVNMRQETATAPRDLFQCKMMLGNVGRYMQGT